MLIELQRAFLPEEMGVEEDCGICGISFTVESVVAHAVAGKRRMDAGVSCRACIEYLALRNPSAFPSTEEYEEAVRRYPEPLFASNDEWGRSEEEGTFGELHETTFIPRRRVPSA
jgi:hypothetical protein